MTDGSRTNNSTIMALGGMPGASIGMNEVYAPVMNMSPEKNPFGISYSRVEFST
ncbi:MAG: hypothetical protein ABIZ09_18565 [Rhodoferax sp.]